MKKNKKIIIIFLGLLIVTATIFAQTFPKVTLGLDQTSDPKDVAVTLQILLLITVLSLAPSILILMTSFTRISIVLGMLRKAAGTQSAPSNKIVIAFSLFLTFFIMSPVFKNANDEALQPYLRGELTHQEAYKVGIQPFRDFMLKYTREKDLALMIKNSKIARPNNAEELPLQVIVPAFAISEIRIALQMGFLIYLPFLMIDMIIASILMSMGMMMLPPVLISAPFKILLFVLVDGWYIVIESLVKSFH
ncbi:MAG: flagellar type III secretion system pore protein FliP [Candidatus Cloacimonadota bacterium]|nr:flagellar type III secretion system pore protein FliP [Candidatus Cloacimonadota bacterium]